MFVSLDLETTGFDPSIDKIIEFGAIKFDLKGNRETMRFFVNPGIILPQIITHITNITNKDLKNAQYFSDKQEEVKSFIGDLPIIGHNIKFDIGFLQHNGLEINNPTYDTQELSSILLPNLPSYSLEILSEKLNLKHQEKHRALDDAIAAMELFIKLIKEFESLDQKLIQKIHTLCERSNWPAGNLLKNLKSTSAHSEPAKNNRLKSVPRDELQPSKTVSQEHKNHNNQSSTTDIYAKILAQSSPAIFELIPPYNNLIHYLSSKAPADAYISIPYHLFRKIHKELPDTLAKIDVAQNYISLQRLEEFSQKSFFENYELTALLKYIIWSKQTKTGLLSEVALFHEERNTIVRVNIDENIPDPAQEYFFKKALEKDQTNAAIYTHQYLVENPPKNKKIFIIDFENFLYSLHRRSSIYLKLEAILGILKSMQELSPGNPAIETLITKTTILFGLLGIIFEKYNDQNIFAARSTVNDNILQTKEWLESQKSLNNLIEISQELGAIKNTKTFGYLQQWKNILKQFHSILQTPEINKNLVWLEKDPKANIILRKVPNSFREKLRDILENSENYQIVDECMDLEDDSNFMKTYSGLNNNLPIIKLNQKSENLEIFIIKDTDGSDKNKVPNFIKEYYERKSPNIAYVFNAKKDLELATLQLSQLDLPVLPQLAGSLGKIQEMFLTQKKTSISPILLLTPSIWKNFEYQAEIDTLIIHKIPFEPPSDPELIALSKNYQNPFMELQIPRAIIELRRIIHRLQKNKTSPKKVILIDPRLSNRQYGETIVNSLNCLAEVCIIRLKKLLSR